MHKMTFSSCKTPIALIFFQNHSQIHIAPFLCCVLRELASASMFPSLPCQMASLHMRPMGAPEGDWRVKEPRKPVPNPDMLVWPADIGEDLTSAKRATVPPPSQIWHLHSQRKQMGLYNHNLEYTAKTTSWKGHSGQPTGVTTPNQLAQTSSSNP